MTSHTARITWTFLVLLALAVTPPAVLAQGAKAPAPDKVNLNTATMDQLQTLPGIGAATAKNIVEYRNKVGKFNKVEELLNVKGIGEKKFQRIKDRLVV